MVFVACVSFPEEEKLVRAYFQKGFEDQFRSLQDAGQYVLNVTRGHTRHYSLARFLLAAVWGYDQTRVAELFGYGFDRWPGDNPELFSWVYKNGVYRPTERNFACEETLHVLDSIKRPHRKTTGDLDEYKRDLPDLSELGQILILTYSYELIQD